MSCPPATERIFADLVTPSLVLMDSDAFVNRGRHKIFHLPHKPKIVRHLRECLYSPVHEKISSWLRL